MSVCKLASQWQTVHYIARLTDVSVVFCSKFLPMISELWVSAGESKHLATETEGVVHGVYKAVTWSSFGVTLRHKLSGGK